VPVTDSAPEATVAAKPDGAAVPIPMVSAAAGPEVAESLIRTEVLSSDQS